MKYSMVLCLLAVVLMQQCVSAYKGGKNAENKSHKHENCDNPGHGEEDHPDRKEEGHKDEDNHGLVNHEIHDHGVHGIYGFHNRKDIVLEKFRLGLQALHRR